MADVTEAKTTGGIGIIGALLILFIALKLTKQIDWSWWWVLSPLWILTGIIVVAFGLAVIFLTIKNAIKTKKKVMR
jgi:hypothetical protein